MLTRWRGGPATATTIFLLVCLLLNTVYVGPAAGFTNVVGGLVGSAYGCTSSYFGCTVGADGNATGNSRWEPNVAMPACTGAVGGTCYAWGVVYSASTYTFDHVQLNVFRASGAWYVRCGVGTDDGNASHNVVTTPRTMASGLGTDYALDTPCVGVNFAYIMVTGAADASSVASTSIYEVNFYQEHTAAASDYIYNLVASHPPFARHYTWDWVRTYTGTWYITNGAGTTLACTAGCQQYLGDPLVAVPLNAGSESGLEVGCLVVCGHDTYTIHITETGVGTVTYAIDSDLDGTLIGTPGVATITNAQPCYQKTTSSCASVTGFSWASISSTAGQAFVNYTFTGASTYSYTVAIQQRGAAVFGTVLRTPGSYTLFMPVDSTQPPGLILTVTGAGGQYVVADMTLDFSAGGAGPVVTQDPTQGAAVLAPTCDAVQIVCTLQQLFAAPGAQLNALALSSVQSIRTTMLTRQPFNFIVRAYDGVSGQLALASAAVTTTSTCTGLVLSVPLGNTSTWRPIPSGWTLPTAPPATSMPVTVADCASLEPLGGQTWYQTVRTAMDPAIYLLFAYSQLRRLQPRPVMAA